MSRATVGDLTVWMLVAAIVLCFLSAWILLPPFHSGALALAVGAPELSPFLLIAALVICGLTMGRAYADTTARVALGLAAIAAVVCAYPLARAASLLPTFNRSMEQAFGADYESLIPAGTRRLLRPNAIAVSDFVRSIARSDPAVRRGIVFATPGGVPLTADVYQPSAAGPHPMLVQIYGGAWQRGAPEDDGSFARYFAAQGYVVVAIDYRHAPAWRWPAQIEDIREAIRWLVAHAAEFGGDSNRIGLIGRSAGAQLALVAAYESGTPRIRAVASYYGPTDLVEGWRTPPRPDPLGTRTILETYLGGTPDTVPRLYQDASPVSYATGPLPPTLLVYGSRDHVVEARFGAELHSRLMQAGSASALLELPWAEHAFDAIPNGVSGQIALYYTERFFGWALR